jgi:hypothetical protein
MSKYYNNRWLRIKDHANEVPDVPEREDLQWPSLEKLTPTNLKRTMSTLMNEWEKSINEPSESTNSAPGKALEVTRANSKSPPII